MKLSTDRLVAWVWNGLFFVLLLALVLGMAFLRLLPDTRQAEGPAITRTEDPTTHIATDMIIPAGFIRAPSGALLPRFASLARPEVAVRTGPGEIYPVAWVVRGGRMPVEIVAESGDWLRIRDHEGEEGWVSRADVSPQRLAMLAPWRRDKRLALRREPAADAPLAAWVMPGLVVRIAQCTGHWCRILVPQAKVEGWIGQEQLWGVYANEAFSQADRPRNATQAPR